MKQQYFIQLEDTPHSAELVQIRSWLLRNEFENPVILELSKAVEHSYSPRSWGFQFSNEANETICRVFFIIQRQNKKSK